MSIALGDACGRGIAVAECRSAADAGCGVAGDTDFVLDVRPGQRRVHRLGRRDRRGRYGGRFFRICQRDGPDGHAENSEDEHEAGEKLLVWAAQGAGP